MSKSLKILKYFFLILFYAFPFFSIGQELPPVLNFDPNQYSAGNQNWMISQAKNKNLYVANGSGLLEYSGEDWSLSPMPNNTVVRSVLAVKDRIYTGAYMEVGYWKKNEFGALKYFSLLSKFEQKLKDGEQFWNILHLDGKVVMQSFSGIYIYDPTIDKVHQIAFETKNRIISIYKVGKSIYFPVDNEGIYTLQNGAPQLLISHELFGNDVIVGMFENNRELDIITRSGKFLNWNGKELNSFNEELNSNLSGLSVFSALRLDDNSTVLGTVENGIFHISSSGKVLHHFNQQNGLLNNTVLSLFEDSEGNVWAGLDNGLAVLNLHSPYTLFRDNNGEIGSVYTSFQSEDFLYLGTNQGLFYKDKLSKKFRLIEGTNGQVWSLQKIDSTIFCGHDQGTFIVTGTEARKISTRSGTWVVKALKGRPNHYVQGHYNGLSFLKKQVNDFKDLPMLADFPHSSKSIVSEPSGEIWVGNEHKGIFKIQLDDSLKKIESLKNYKFDDISGITSSIFKFNDSLYYSSVDKILKYEPQSDKFMENSLLAKTMADLQLSSGRIINENDKKIWGFGKNLIFTINRANLNIGYNLETVYLPNDLRNITTGYENISALGSGTYLMGVANGYVKFEKFGESPSTYHVRIDRITKSKIDQPAELAALNGGPAHHYKTNNFSFYYSSPVFKKFIEPLYSYRLVGLSTNWSNWSPSSNASFKNLDYGKYSFEVRAKIGKELTDTVSYSFEIARPWYLSFTAIMVYVLLLLVALYLVHIAYRRYHKKIIIENEKALHLKNLEAEQKITMLEKEQLERDMANKSRELAASTMSLIKKNEFLNDIKEKLKDAEDRGEVKSVINTIDKDISEEDNWNFFKKAFSNADKDFFKKIKNKHPELSSNDLKLCAYLRLNLSSKEIAPLLNISVKSVEIKRYRLRKKMDLDREVNLSDYILSI